MIKKTIYEAKDGTAFDTRRDCIVHENRHICPKCDGHGAITRMYDAYPSGLPDSGWASDMKSQIVDCDICHGNGFTPNKMSPITKVVGYQ